MQEAELTAMKWSRQFMSAGKTRVEARVESMQKKASKMSNISRQISFLHRIRRRQNRLILSVEFKKFLHILFRRKSVKNKAAYNFRDFEFEFTYHSNPARNVVQHTHTHTHATAALGGYIWNISVRRHRNGTATHQRDTRSDALVGRYIVKYYKFFLCI